MEWVKDLIQDIRTHSGHDDADNNTLGIIRDVPWGGTEEFSNCNRSYLNEKFLSMKDNCRAILEIGVCRNHDKSSTWSFLNNKKDETIYIGIDLDDKSFLNNKEKNIYTIQANSSNVDQNIEMIKNLGVTELDFIFIDGWHSINQVLTDWEYTKLLSNFGIVGFHDTSEHPGPYKFIRAMNPEIWQTEIFCPSDHGIGFAKKK